MPASVVRESWPGVQKLRNLVVFGDSYSDVGYNAKQPHPTPENPLGVEYPGVTWCGEYNSAAKTYTYLPNWVGHLVRLVKEKRSDGPPLLVYDYARGGDRIDGIARQVHDHFLQHLATKPDWAPWSQDDTLFLTWVGINDCAWNKETVDIAASCRESIRALFALQEELYGAGARNFCFIDVPPTYDYAGGMKPVQLREAVLAWNAALDEAATKFGEEHADATVIVWSSWKLFKDLIADPTPYESPQKEAVKGVDALTEDGLHPTSAVHRAIAQELLEFLFTVRRSDEVTA